MNDNAGVEKNAKMPEKGRFAYADALMKFDIADRLTLRNVGFGRRELGQRDERGTRAVEPALQMIYGFQDHFIK